MDKRSEIIDEKLSELCTQLATLGSISEKTAAINDVARTLASVGDERVHQVEDALTEFSKKTSEAVVGARGCIDKLNKLLLDIRQVPFVDELHELREAITSRSDELKQEIENLSLSLTKNSTEVTNIRQNVSDYALQTKEGLTELDTTVRDRTSELDTKFEKGQSRQEKGVDQMKKSLSDDIGGTRTAITEAVTKCEAAVEACQNSVNAIRRLATVTLFALIVFMVMAFPGIKAAWTRLLQ